MHDKYGIWRTEKEYDMYTRVHFLYYIQNVKPPHVHACIFSFRMDMDGWFEGGWCFFFIDSSYFFSFYLSKEIVCVCVCLPFLCYVFFLRVFTCVDVFVRGCIHMTAFNSLEILIQNPICPPPPFHYFSKVWRRRSFMVCAPICVRRSLVESRASRLASWLGCDGNNANRVYFIFRFYVLWRQTMQKYKNVR